MVNLAANGLQHEVLPGRWSILLRTDCNIKYYLVDGQFSCERIDDKVLVVAIGAKTFWQFTFLQVALGCSVRVLLLINIKNHNLIIKNQALGGRCEMRRESKYPI